MEEEKFIFLSEANIGYLRIRPLIVKFNICIHPGELILIKGDNGSGKTTLLRTIAGQLPLLGGKGKVLSYNLYKTNFTKLSSRGLFFLMQNHPFIQNVSVGYYIKLLSLGQIKRIHLSLLQNTSRQLLLLDEPFAGLDKDGKIKVEQLILENIEKKKAILLVEHSSELGQFATRTIHL